MTYVHLRVTFGYVRDMRSVTFDIRMFTLTYVRLRFDSRTLTLTFGHLRLESFFDIVMFRCPKKDALFSCTNRSLL